MVRPRIFGPVEALAGRAAADFDGFYHSRQAWPAADADVMVLSADGKGIVMRHDSLRAATAKAASESTSKLTTRLSQGEKANRKRMATVGAVYTATPAVRTPADIITPEGHHRAPGPTAADKWLTASVIKPAATVIADIFDEATRRDPTGDRVWVALVDGNRHQIDRIRHEAARDGLDPPARRNADKAANYLATKADQSLLDYPTALAAGWPIATGVIEGACRHLVKDRMDITGARWSLEGAEAVLKLRALHANGDLDTYWTYHLKREHHRSRYDHDIIPIAT